MVNYLKLDFLTYASKTLINIHEIYKAYTLSKAFHCSLCCSSGFPLDHMMMIVMKVIELLLYSAIFSLSYLLMQSIFSISKNKKKKLPPGPISLPIIGNLHLLGPLIHHSFQKLSRTYGDLIYLRLGSVGCVVGSSPQMAKELLKTHEFDFCERKLTAAIEYLTYNSSMAFAPYGPYWKFVKKISKVELLGSRSLDQFLPLRTQEISTLVKLLMVKSKAGESVNVTEELQKLTNNVMAQMMFSKTCAGKDGEEARRVAREVTQMFGEVNASDMIWLFKNWDVRGYRKRFMDIHRRYDSLLEKIITERENERKKEEEEEEVNKMKDFLDMMLDIIEKEENSELQLTRTHIKALILDLLTAATDTTTMSVEWALAELINNPSVLQKAQKEIDDYIEKSNFRRLIQESDIPNLPYLQAIVKENFRLHPPIPLINRISIQDCHINDYTIPKDTMMFVNMWAIGRDPTVWENPMEFQPKRFLQLFTDQERIDVKGMNYQLLPFGSGRRSCPGVSLAMLEVSTTLAILIQCFNWKVVGTDGAEIKGGDNGMNLVDMSEQPGLTTPRVHNLVCVPLARFTATDLPDN